MGRLGFNIVRQKEPNKGVEAGGPPDQQNEKNESAELNDIVIAVGEERRKCRKNLPGLIAFITTIIFFSAYMAIRLRSFHHQSTGVAEAVKSPEAELDCSDKMKDYMEQASNHCATQLIEVNMKWLVESNYLHEQLSFANLNIVDLKQEFELLKLELNKTSSELQLSKDTESALRSERDQLKEALEKERLSKELLEKEKPAKEELPTLKPETSEPRTTAKPAVSIFDSPSFRRVNDIVKYIDNVGRIIGNAFKDGI